MKESTKEKSKEFAINLGAGAAAGAISGLAVAPLATVADIAGTNAKSPGDSFYGKSYKDITKSLYQGGVNKRIIEKNAPEVLKNLLQDSEKMKADRTLSKAVAELRTSNKITKDLGALEKLYYGMKEFYGGQGLKAVKIAPQNAINFAVFGALSMALANKLKSDKK